MHGVVQHRSVLGDEAQLSMQEIHIAFRARHPKPAVSDMFSSWHCTAQCVSTKNAETQGSTAEFPAVLGTDGHRRTVQWSSVFASGVELDCTVRND